MDLIFKHHQDKKNKNSPVKSSCDLKLYVDENNLLLRTEFVLDYYRYKNRRFVTFTHELTINLKNGNIDILHKIWNDDVVSSKKYKSSEKLKRNNFKMLYELIDSGVYRGEKRLHYWGVRYGRAIEKLITLISEKLKSEIKNEFYLNKTYKEKYQINELYDLIVDFHLEKKNIKGHDNVYNDIMDVYPLKKHLKLNDNKFLPAILDSLGIKSKYLIKELSSSDLPLNINAVKYMCQLFGKNHLDYLKRFDWKDYCMDVYPSNIKIEELRNEHEKNSFVKLIDNWNQSIITSDPMFVMINKLLKIRKHIESIGVKINLTPKDDEQFHNLLDRLDSIKSHHKRGYKIRHKFPNDFLEDIQTDIVYDEYKYSIKVLTTEEDFIYEGFKMKNCMSKQFTNSTIYVYLSAKVNNTCINLQYRRGNLIQSYGKANTETPTIFEPLIGVLNKKFSKYKDLKWTKEKYDFISNQ